MRLRGPWARRGGCYPPFFLLLAHTIRDSLSAIRQIEIYGPLVGTNCAAAHQDLWEIWSADGLPPLSVVRLASRGPMGGFVPSMSLRTAEGEPSSPKAKASRPHSIALCFSLHLRLHGFF